MLFIYTDGGQAGDNPSYTGGAWGFRVVRHALPARGTRGDGGTLGPPDSDNDAVVLERTATLTPADLAVPYVTNNNVELYALCEAVNAVFALSPRPEAVTFCPDSSFALKCVRRLCRVDSQPQAIRLKLGAAWHALNRAPFPVHWELIAGHPEKGKVVDGLKHKGTEAKPRLYRVSQHNAAVDRACTACCADLTPPDWSEVAERPGDGLFTIGELVALKQAGCG